MANRVFSTIHSQPQSLDYWQLQKIKSALGISVRNDALLTTALTHSSYLNEPEGAGTQSNDSLATIGDAALQLAITGSLYEIDAALDKGQITLIRSRVVGNKTLARVARERGIGDYLALRMGKGEKKSGGANKPSNLACAFEAIVGAIYLDNKVPAGAFAYVANKDGNAAFKFCENVLKDEIAAAYHAVTAPPKPKPKQRNGKSNQPTGGKTKQRGKDKPAAKKQPAKKQSAKAAGPNIAGKHPKTALQEIIQAKRGHGNLPEYRLAKSTGKANNPTFSVDATLNGKTLGKGSGSSKKAAETAAAKQALRAGAF